MAISESGLVEFLRNDLAIDVNDIASDTLLFSTGIIDSFALVTLMTYIEVEGDVRISPADVNLANFDSISRILNYVSRVRA